MKKINLIAVLLLLCTIPFVTVDAKKKKKQNDENPFGQTYSTPCEIYDSPAEFTANGIFTGSSRQMGEVQKYALENAQEIVRLKMKHAYKGMVSDYSSTHGNDKGNTLEKKISSAGDRIIDAVVNETMESCKSWSKISDDGQITCYVAIRIPKADLAAKVAKEVQNQLTQDEKTRIDFNESEYRKQMEERFKQFQEGK